MLLLLNQLDLCGLDMRGWSWACGGWAGGWVGLRGSGMGQPTATEQSGRYSGYL